MGGQRAAGPKNGRTSLHRFQGDDPPQFFLGLSGAIAAHEEIDEASGGREIVGGLLDGLLCSELGCLRIAERLVGGPLEPLAGVSLEHRERLTGGFRHAFASSARGLQSQER